ncbi:hypothetical protein COCON_G00046890 [Conger conger]|uniref:Uncharacterized protein n=1 Tax=Conger conger TaxID=82655 RepID=A0A9Q1DUS1_CONCO|nr:hypothetical protein COCON_G00046890 [Conger conger]
MVAQLGREIILSLPGGSEKMITPGVSDGVRPVLSHAAAGHRCCLEAGGKKRR